MRHASNRMLLAFSAALWFAPFCGADDGEVRPVQARVVTAGAVVRSGPADTYYLTDTLPEDTVVEVYRRQLDGWCAIRPPEDSFSWVYAQHVQSAGDGVAQISRDDVPARVGSRLSARRNVVQVRLHQGEIVEIVGDEQQEGEVWYKIAPPAGEFRWMLANDLAPVGSGDVAWEPAAAIATVSLEQPADGPPDDDPEELTAPPLASESTTTWTAAGDTQTAANSPTVPEDITPVGSPVGSNVAAMAGAASADFASQLGELELRLSRMVAEPTGTWSVDVLEQAAERLLSQADTVSDRAAVKTTLAKVDRFAAIQRRHVLIHGGAGRPLERPPVAANESAAAAETVSIDAASASPFDAVGTLRPVVSRRPGAPQFALVNNQGQVVSFLTPTPDLNLQPYLGRRIGVVGSQGYIPEFRRAHVTASRVTPLAERQLR